MCALVCMEFWWNITIIQHEIRVFDKSRCDYKRQNIYIVSKSMLLFDAHSFSLSLPLPHFVYFTHFVSVVDDCVCTYHFRMYGLGDEAFALIHVTTFMCNFRFLYPHFITAPPAALRNLVSLIVFFFFGSRTSFRLGLIVHTTVTFNPWNTFCLHI